MGKKAKAKDEMLASVGIKWEKPWMDSIKQWERPVKGYRVIDLATGEIMPPSFITINSVKLLKRFALVALLLGLVAIGYGIGAVSGGSEPSLPAVLAPAHTLLWQLDCQVVACYGWQL